MKDKPVRLYKQEDELEKLENFLNSDLVFKIKVYIVLAIAMFVFLAVCFLLKGQTYGYL